MHGRATRPQTTSRGQVLSRWLTLAKGRGRANTRGAYRESQTSAPRTRGMNEPPFTSSFGQPETTACRRAAI